MGFSRQEYWNGLSCPPPGDLLNPGIETASSEAPALQIQAYKMQSPLQLFSNVGIIINLYINSLFSLPNFLPQANYSHVRLTGDMSIMCNSSWLK